MRERLSQFIQHSGEKDVSDREYSLVEILVGRRWRERTWLAMDVFS